MKRRLNTVAGFLLAAILAFSLIGCADKEEPHPLENALAAYLQTDEFAESLSASTTQARLPVMYLRYIDANYYGDMTEIERILNIIDTAINDDGKLDEQMFEQSDVNKSLSGETGKGWYSYLDYLYTFSLAYNQHRENALKSGKSASEYAEYLPVIQEYLDSLCGIVYNGSGNDGDVNPKVAWGHTAQSCIVAVYANLGLDKSDSYMLAEDSLAAAYARGDDGAFVPSVDCNWVGFSGNPLSRSLLTARDDYSAEYEKSMQAYYPLQDAGFSPQGIDDTVTFDRLYDNYLGDIGGGSYVDPRYALLTMYAHGIDPEHYVMTGGGERDIISLWLNSLEKKGDESYKLRDTADMALAVAYLAGRKGINANPLGLVTKSNFVIKSA